MVISQELKKKIIDLYKLNIPIKIIINELNMSKASVYRVNKNYKLNNHYSNYSLQLQEDIKPTQIDKNILNNNKLLEIPKLINEILNIKKLLLEINEKL